MHSPLYTLNISPLHAATHVHSSHVQLPSPIIYACIGPSSTFHHLYMYASMHYPFKHSPVNSHYPCMHTFTTYPSIIHVCMNSPTIHTCIHAFTTYHHACIHPLHSSSVHVLTRPPSAYHAWIHPLAHHPSRHTSFIYCFWLLVVQT